MKYVLLILLIRFDSFSILNTFKFTCSISLGICSNKWIFNNVTTSITPFHTNYERLILKSISIQISNSWPDCAWLFTDTLCSKWSTRIKQKQHQHQPRHHHNKDLLNEFRHLYNIVFFHRILKNVYNITYISSILDNGKIVTISIQSIFSSNQLCSLLNYFQNGIDMVLFQSLWFEFIDFHTISIQKK